MKFSEYSAMAAPVALAGGVGTDAAAELVVLSDSRAAERLAACAAAASAAACSAASASFSAWDLVCGTSSASMPPQSAS